MKKIFEEGYFSGYSNTKLDEQEVTFPLSILSMGIENQLYSFHKCY